MQNLSNVKKKDIVLISDWSPPYTANWNENVARFVEACKDKERAKLEAQFFFSYIILNQQWKEEMIWYDHSTGERYEGEEQIPPDRKHMVSLKQRWTHQAQFIDWCVTNVPGFAKHTFPKRHAVIDKLYEVGMDFVDAVKIVAGLKIWGGSEKVLDVFEFDEYHHVIGFKPELAENLPDVGELEEVPEEEQLETVSRAAIDYLTEQAVAVEDGVLDPKKLSQKVKKDIQKKPKVRIVKTEGKFPFAIEATYPTDNNYDLGTVERVYIQFISEEGEVLDRLPDDMREWWAQKHYLKREMGLAE